MFEATECGSHLNLCIFQDDKNYMYLSRQIRNRELHPHAPTLFSLCFIVSVLPSQPQAVGLENKNISSAFPSRELDILQWNSIYKRLERLKYKKARAQICKEEREVLYQIDKLVGCVRCSSSVVWQRKWRRLNRGLKR